VKKAVRKAQKENTQGTGKTDGAGSKSSEPEKGFQVSEEEHELVLPSGGKK